MPFVALAEAVGSDKPYHCCRQAMGMSTYASKNKAIKTAILR
jgi:hypothetical protein